MGIRLRGAGLLVAVGLVAACIGGGGAPDVPAVPAREPGERADLVVAQDGRGDFRTIQHALDALPADGPAYRVILLRNGTYREKVFITKSRVALVGENRERTRVVFSELRSEWRKTHPDDWGAAVVNVGEGVEDLVLANLTIRNDYGSHGGSHDHQFAVRSGKGTTRISVLHANVLADGGDTMSLWNSASGMYYHAGSTFEGYVDFFCPRGWSYATDCRFVSHSTSASIWHDGSAAEEQKLVIRSSHFEGDAGFALGRITRDGQFYLVDCTFSGAMADRPIYLAREPETFRWGLRAYFWNCRRDGGDFPWFADSLYQARGAPRADEIDARWTFGGKWDPEGTLPAVLPFASIPTPRNGARVVPSEVGLLRWIGARGAVAYDVRFGRKDPPPLVARVKGTAYEPGPLTPGVTYFWRVDAVMPRGSVEGPIWRLTAVEPEGRTAAARQ
ncbi:MAG: hypothetical protein A2Y78_16495 [Acidobacteria bacterium RBG_13_68_16]|nr:MAG: hypothetical protein A2Y78_16495 [Acidobacteria bacterium RBG_13_68_16]